MKAQLEVLREREVAAVLAAALYEHVRVRAHLTARTVGAHLVRGCTGVHGGARGRKGAQGTRARRGARGRRGARARHLRQCESLVEEQRVRTPPFVAQMHGGEQVVRLGV